jgi:para-aminobenzoate synthetase/4-amino-4-deoxychorismate lyase
MLVRDGEARDLAAHLARLRESVRELYDAELPSDLELGVQRAAAPHARARLRVLHTPTTGVSLETHSLEEREAPAPVGLSPVALPGGLGAHKWADRRLLDGLARRLGGVPLVVDLDGEVLEAAHANVWAVEGRDLVTPPLDGRLLPGITRARLFEDPPEGLDPREEAITLERLAAADEILLSSSIRGLHAAALAGAPQPALLGSRA